MDINWQGLDYWVIIDIDTECKIQRLSFCMKSLHMIFFKGVFRRRYSKKEIDTIAKSKRTKGKLIVDKILHRKLETIRNPSPTKHGNEVLCPGMENSSHKTRG